jgi:multidrug efflux pump subunit AcrA (membrane-fusion protein)
MNAPLQFPNWYLHADTDRQATERRVVQWARETLGAERAALLRLRGKRWRVTQVSGVSQLHRHSTTLRAMEASADRLLRSKQSIVYPGDREFSPQETEAIDQLLDVTGAAAFRLMPMLVPGDRSEGCLGAILIERFSSAKFDGDLDSLDDFIKTATVALKNSDDASSLPGLIVWRGLRWLLAPLQRCKALFIGALLALSLSSLWFVETHQWMEVEGELKPVQARHIFAPGSGIVNEVSVENGASVAPDEALLKIVSHELDRTERQLAGELRTSQQQLVAIRAQRLNASSNRDTKASSYDPQLTELRQLESEVKNLESQLLLIHEELAQLEVKSPIAGHVVTWDLQQRLKNRPVSRGDLLLSIESIHQESWELWLDLPQSKLGPVMVAHRQRPKLPIRFALGTAPEAAYEAELISMATAIQTNPSKSPYLRLKAQVTSTLNEDIAKSGTSVRAKIDCGKKPLIKAWFHDIRHWWAKHVIFWLQ